MFFIPPKKNKQTLRARPRPPPIPPLKTSPMLQITPFPLNPISENTYILTDTTTSQCAIVDPGCLTPQETQQITQHIATHHLTPTHILLTHLHFDHIWGVATLAQQYPNIQILSHQADDYLLADNAPICSLFQLPAPQSFNITHHVTHGQNIQLGQSQLTVIETPGHTPGSICYHAPADSLLLSGDTLFQYSCGRTDLPGGSQKAIEQSIRTRLLTLPEQTKVYPGHGAPTTIQHEKLCNIVAISR